LPDFITRLVNSQFEAIPFLHLIPIQVYHSFIFANFLRLAYFFDAFGTIIDKYSCFDQAVNEGLTTSSVWICQPRGFCMDMDTAPFIQSRTRFLSHWFMAIN